MKKDLSPAAVWGVIGVVVVVVVLIMVFGVFKPQIGKGPEIEAKPWSPSGYAGAPQGTSNQQGGTAPAPYRGPGGPMGAPSAPPSNSK